MPRPISTRNPRHARHYLPVPGAFDADNPQGEVRQIADPAERKPGEIVYRHKPTDALYAVYPGTESLRNLQREAPLDWEQVFVRP
jgi:hypothetical protein